MKNIFILFCIFLSLQYSNTFAQNLIPNPGFEVYDTCPNLPSQLDYCTSWKSVSHTADYYNSCNYAPFGTPYTGVPNNSFGYQQAHSGCGYSGVYTRIWDFPLWHECFQAKLDTSLTIGTRYYVSFYISLNDGGLMSGTNKFGCMLTTYAYPAWSYLIGNYATFFTDSIVTDTANWVKISGSFIADSAYQYITFGNFFDDSSTQYTIVIGTPSSVYSYYYIDDVCLSPDSLSCVYVTYSCTYLEIEDHVKNKLIVYPNPFSDVLTFDSGVNKELEICIYDVLSRLIWKQPFHSKVTFFGKELNSGFYFYEIRENENIFSTGKIIKN